ncbi:hypothetical protein [Escherichia coli]|uniref:hypothetical protein n=1 Tax=Escherichia coli TaxID=562 RepID=UPI00191959CD|nr:hypothetical protein [Escherichia coli]CAD6040538.1 Uncharacterised protein [Escherichia coli]CAD6090508.1 Uncharacterised protein [Escherichia coli]CAD6122221.1 Uncharacterised protein [Escherichia coli]
MWIVILIIIAFTVWFFININASANDRHAEIRKEATKRILSQEKNLNSSSSVVKSVYKNETKPQKKKKQKKRKTPYSGGYPVEELDLEIIYEDANGDITERQISVLKYDPVIRKIYAWCHLRRDSRTFFEQRIHSATDVDAGEVLSNVHEYILERLDT